MASALPSKQRILQLLAEGDRARHAHEIADELGVSAARYPGLVRLLDDLVYEGQLSVRPGHRYKLGGDTKKVRGLETDGFLSMTPRGAGFVATGGTAGDVFVPPEAIGGAMHGDKVRVAIVARGARGPEGEIAEVLERTSKRVAGVLRRRGKSAWLEPDDSRIRGPIALPADVDVRGAEGNSGKDGDAAVVTITRYPALLGENPVGKLDAVLGTPGELNVEVAKVLVRERVDELHTEQAVREAESFGEAVPHEMLAGRDDLTHLPLPTIDPEDARDHDDAVWVERTPSGGYRAWIAIADVSSYVRPETLLDAEARGRGCSVYLPDRAIPMLPRALSSNLCSLLPDVLRLCLCAEVELDAGGNVKSEKLHRGFMKSQAKLTYGGVARALGFTMAEPPDPKAEAMVEGLRVANELARALRGKRMQRGALDFELPEAKIVLHETTGQPVDVQRRAQDAGVKKAYQLIEELMLLANEVVARWLIGRQRPAIFRVHPPPDEEKLVRFVTMCEELGIAVDIAMTQDPKKLSDLLKSLATHPNAAVLNMLLLRSMKQASYDVVNIGHFGLASKAYVHFTSPIRRYPDLLVHRQVHDAILGHKVDRSPEAESGRAEAALLSSRNERRAMEVEREVADLYRVTFMRDKVGSRFEGRVTGLVGSGVYVALDAPFVDVLVRYEDLGPERYELDDSGLRAIATRSGAVVKLGDRMLVEVIDVALLRRTVYARRIGGQDGAPLERRGPQRGRRGAEVRSPGKTQRTKDQRAARGGSGGRRATKGGATKRGGGKRR